MNQKYILELYPAGRSEHTSRWSDQLLQVDNTWTRTFSAIQSLPHSPPPPKVGVATSEKYWILDSGAVSLFLYSRHIWRCGKLEYVLRSRRDFVSKPVEIHFHQTIFILLHKWLDWWIHISSCSQISFAVPVQVPEQAWNMLHVQLVPPFLTCKSSDLDWIYIFTSLRAVAEGYCGFLPVAAYMKIEPGKCEREQRTVWCCLHCGCERLFTGNWSTSSKICTQLCPGFYRFYPLFQQNT